MKVLLRIGGWLALIIVGILAAGVLALSLAIALAYPNLPPIDSLTDYRPKIPLRVFTADNVLIGEFGEERRNVARIAEVPEIMKQAILAAEDERFYQHGGIDYLGVLRAATSNAVRGSSFGGGRRQGASTITQQVARNFFLSSEQSYTRKFYEVLMAFKIEASLTKDQILEVYINQIYLGEHAYGFASAERIYFGKALAQVTAAEAAMLAGIPKAPSAYNPVVNPTRARARQEYVLSRMLALGYLTPAQFQAALGEKLGVKAEGSEFAVHAEYVAEMARQIVYDQYKEDTYSRGIVVHTTIRSEDQAAAYAAVRSGVLDYEKRHNYDGPESFVDLPDSTTDLDQAVEDALLEFSDSDDLLVAVVLEAGPKLVRAARVGESIEISGDGLRFASAALTDKAPPAKRLRRGAVIRVRRIAKGGWEIVQMPQVQAELVSANVHDGAVRALIGGFDFNRNKFNHTTQAWRQPGSGFKPFVYSAALERGFTPTTIINDAPIVIDASETGSQVWEPKNYDGKYEGPMTMREALAKSKNMVTVRIMRAIGPKYVQGYIGRFGFDPDKHPPYLPMALGAGSVTAWQMLGAFSVFANGGYKVNPYFIASITDGSGRELARAHPSLAGDPANRVIDARNAFIMDSLLKGVAKFGTGARASATLKRNDLGGKTGTTNDSRDIWFSGYANDQIVAVAWVGYDQPRSLGIAETGSSGALPIWISYMQTALKGLPEIPRPIPEGVITINGEYYFAEYPPDKGVTSLGLDDPVNTNAASDTGTVNGGATAPPPPPPPPPSVPSIQQPYH